MTSTQIIVEKLEGIPENELIFASKYYTEQFIGKVTESAYYKTLERLVKSGELCKISRGVYYRPKKNRYGIVPPSESEIVFSFTKHDTGMVVGYALYNNLKLTTQVSKNIEVLSSQIDQQTKSISNVLLSFCNLVYTPEVKGMIQMLEVLQNFYKIQDLNYKQFINYCEQFVIEYNGTVFEQVCREIRYQKRTIAFLREILEYYKVPNDLNRYLSSLSDYKYPTMEEIHDTAQIS